MVWFWGTVAGVLVLAFAAAWFYDRRGGTSGMSDRERASFQRSRQDPYRTGDNYGGVGGFDGGAGF